MMRFILKLITAPVALALTVVCIGLKFVLSMSEVLFGIVSGVVFIAAVLLLVTGQTTGGIAWMAAAFLLSPLGLPALAGWLVKGLDSIGGALKTFIFA